MACKQEPSVVMMNGFGDEMSQEKDEKPDDLEKHVEIVVRTWALVKQDMLKHGTDFYLRLLSEHPELKSLFSFSANEPEDLDKENLGLKHQAKLLMTMIDYAVRSLGDLDELVPKVKRLGKRHFVKYHVKPEYFQPVGESLLWTLREGLGEIFTSEVEAAWSAIYSILADLMIEGGQEATTEDKLELTEEE